ncbi:MAG: OmpA family protein [Rhodospirillales bacterium]|nr:OmpA family protein [Rhodospirillales bacterium]
MWKSRNHPRGRWGSRRLEAVALVALLCACQAAPDAAIEHQPIASTAVPTAAAATVAVPAKPKPITEFPVLPLEEAVLSAANEVFSKAALTLPDATGEHRRALAIDPLIDAATSAQLVATHTMQDLIVRLVSVRYPQLEVRPFTQGTLAQLPLLLIGTLTAIDGEGMPATTRDSYRVWLTLIDMRAGKIIAKARARARSDTVDAAPTPNFRDSPAWSDDPAGKAYVETCHQGKVGESPPAAFVNQLPTETLITNAVDAYDNGRYQEALVAYREARDLPGGAQLRVYNGIYLSNLRLGRESAAEQAFGDVVDYGLQRGHLAVKLLFKPGSTAFWPDPTVSGSYPMWLRQIAQRTAEEASCLEIRGHTSRTGPEPLNERLALLRAEQIKRRLEFEQPTLTNRTIASGVGSRENLVGTGTDDAVDALDRRVEFVALGC